MVRLRSPQVVRLRSPQVYARNVVVADIQSNPLENVMAALSVEYSFETDPAGRFLCMKILNRSWGSGEMISVFAEVAEAMVKSSYQNLCFDLSELTVVPSSAFGGCMNIIESARTESKNVRFRLNPEAVETAQLAGIGNKVKIEVRMRA